MTPSNSQSPRKNYRWAGVLALLVVFAAAATAIILSQGSWAVPSAAKKLKNPVPATEDAIDEGMFNYMKHCQSCHGENGDGNGKRAETLSIKPADFTNANLMSERTDGEIFWQITHGRRPMPGFEDKLSDTERWQLVDYIRSLAQKQGEPKQP